MLSSIDAFTVMINREVTLQQHFWKLRKESSKQLLSLSVAPIKFNRELCAGMTNSLLKTMHQAAPVGYHFRLGVIGLLIWKKSL